MEIKEYHILNLFWKVNKEYIFLIKKIIHFWKWNLLQEVYIKQCWFSFEFELFLNQNLKFLIWIQFAIGP
jgi:hypothetical protein